MAEKNKNELLKEYEFYSRLIRDHEASTKNAQLKASCIRNSNNFLPQKPNVKYESHPYKMNTSQISSSFNKSHAVFNKTNRFAILGKKNSVLINKSTQNKYVLQNNQIPSKFPYVTSSSIKSNVFINANTSLVPTRKDLQPEVKSEKSNSCMQLMEEIVTLSQLIKQQTSENGKLSSTSNNTNSFSKYKTVNGGIVFPTNKIVSNISSKSVPSDSMRISTKQSVCTANLNPVPLKQFNGNKYCYKKSESKIYKPFTTVRNKNALKNCVPKRCVVFSLNKTNISETENADKTLHLSPDRQNLTVKLNMTKDSVLISSDVSTKSFTPAKVKAPSQLTFKTSSIYKSPKISKLNTCVSRYTKVNKRPTTPKTNSLCRVIMPKSAKKINKKINRYKVINKNRTPGSKKSNTPKSKINRSVTVEESESLQELNDSTIDKLEKDLLAISTAFTATPISSKSSEPCQNIAKGNLKLNFYKTSPKKPKSKVSKYKIVNGSNLPNCHQGKKQNIASLKIGVKQLSCSKYKLVNKNLRPVQILTPSRRGKSVLVKRLFKSKNALINKNSSPTSFSAKIIKSKYLALNKRKFPSWQKNDHIKVPFQQRKFKGYYVKAKLPYGKGFQNPLLWKGTQKFSNHQRQALSRKFSKNPSRSLCKKKLKNRYAYSPVVIHGVKYSINSSGKALKKLYTPKGHMTKIVRKTYVKTPENFKSPMPTSNLASRALHRSINRILCASTKKNLTKVNTYCMFYNRFGRCNNGVKCTYIHDPSKIAVCTRFLRGTCKVDGCPFSHEITPGKMAVCSFFLVGACEKENCPYRHEELLPDAILCKAFVQGYCHKGKECKKAHILVCPKYIQGECDKGSSCAFPHPPKKAKKNVQKDDNEIEKKPEDVFMEKVARYFQAESTCLSSHKSDESKSNQCVPKQRKKLEEQPSFIPLFGTPQTSDSL